MKLWSEEEQDERMRKAKLMFNFALELCLLQSRNGSGFVLENPVAASSWQLPLVQQGLAEWPGTQFVSFDQCRLGLCRRWGVQSKRGQGSSPTCLPLSIILIKCNARVFVRTQGCRDPNQANV